MQEIESLGPGGVGKDLHHVERLLSMYRYSRSLSIHPGKYASLCGCRIWSMTCRFLLVALSTLCGPHKVILHKIAMMGDYKQPVTMQLSPEADTFDNSLSAEKRGTAPDQYDMQRMGKTQETKVSSPAIPMANRN